MRGPWGLFHVSCPNCRRQRSSWMQNHMARHEDTNYHLHKSAAGAHRDLFARICKHDLYEWIYYSNCLHSRADSQELIHFHKLSHQFRGTDTMPITWFNYSRRRTYSMNKNCNKLLWPKPLSLFLKFKPMFSSFQWNISLINVFYLNK